MHCNSLASDADGDGYCMSGGTSVGDLSHMCEYCGQHVLILISLRGTAVHVLNTRGPLENGHTYCGIDKGIPTRASFCRSLLTVNEVLCIAIDLICVCNYASLA